MNKKNPTIVVFESPFWSNNPKMLKFHSCAAFLGLAFALMTVVSSVAVLITAEAWATAASLLPDMAEDLDTEGVPVMVMATTTEVSAAEWTLCSTVWWWYSPYQGYSPYGSAYPSYPPTTYPSYAPPTTYAAPAQAYAPAPTYQAPAPQAYRSWVADFNSC